MSQVGVGRLQLTESYIDSATIHGVSKLQRNSLYLLRPVIWLTLMLIMLGGLSYLLYEEITRYFSYPTVTSITVQYQSQLAFPAVTLCSLNNVKRSVKTSCADVGDAIMMSNLFFDMSELKEMEDAGVFSNRPLGYMLYGNATGYEFRDCVLQNSNKEDTFLKYCTWEGRARNCTNIFRPIVTDDGLCYTFNDRAAVHSTTPSSGLRVLLDIDQNASFFSFTMHAGVKVIINEPGEMPLPTKDALLVPPGLAANIELLKEKRVGLPQPFKAFGGDRYCEDTADPNFVHRIRKPHGYTPGACERECYRQILADKCGCRHFFDTREGDQPPCTLEQMNNCYIKASVNLTRSKKWRDGCDCPLPCSSTRYHTRVSYAEVGSTYTADYLLQKNMIPSKDYLRKNFIDLNIFYTDLVTRTVKEVPEIQISSILGSIGGNMGLFLGASLLSVSELVELLVLLIVSCCRRNANPVVCPTLPKTLDKDTKRTKKVEKYDARVKRASSRPRRF